MPGRGLVIDVPEIEGGTFVLAQHSARIDVVPVSVWKGIDDIYEYLRKNASVYQWVAIDSLTAFTELAKRKTISERDLDADPHMISQQEWGKVGRLVGELIYRFRKLPQHVIWVAQERTFKAGDFSPVILGPDVSPAVLSDLLPTQLIVGRLTVEQNSEGGYERRLLVGQDPTCHTKMRAPADKDVPRRIKNPNLGGLLRYMFGTGERPEEVNETIAILLS